ncbi:MAG: polyphenol oxidase family protein, partial [Solimonas sp.]
MPAPDVGLLAADWPAPPGIRAGQTTRAGGLSAGPYATLNLGSNTKDDPLRVAANRARLREALRLPREPAWLKQVHGTTVVDATAVRAGDPAPAADASVSAEAGVACVVLTADCLPVLFCSDDGRWVGAAH